MHTWHQRDIGYTCFEWSRKIKTMKAPETRAWKSRQGRLNDTYSVTGNGILWCSPCLREGERVAQWMGDEKSRALKTLLKMTVVHEFPIKLYYSSLWWLKFVFYPTLCFSFCFDFINFNYVIHFYYGLINIFTVQNVYLWMRLFPCFYGY